MARVYVAVERGDRSGALFAVKRLHPHLRDDPRARRTLFDEARLAGNVTHPNVLKVHGTGRDTDGPYLAMDYVDGISLAELYSAVKRLDEEMPLQVCVDVTRQIALGLHAVHEQHEVHLRRPVDRIPGRRKWTEAVEHGEKNVAPQGAVTIEGQRTPPRQHHGPRAKRCAGSRRANGQERRHCI